jgi:hypothetical protein
MTFEEISQDADRHSPKVSIGRVISRSGVICIEECEGLKFFIARQA